MAKEIFNCKWLGLLKIQGLTIYPVIFYYPKKPLKKLVDHEHTHIKQVKQEGQIKFYLKYVSEYLRNRFDGMGHWEAYRNISYEREVCELRELKNI